MSSGPSPESSGISEQRRQQIIEYVRELTYEELMYLKQVVLLDARRRNEDSGSDLPPDE